jgi:hypothetical protein
MSFMSSPPASTAPVFATNPATFAGNVRAADPGPGNAGGFQLGGTSITFGRAANGLLGLTLSDLSLYRHGSSADMATDVNFVAAIAGKGYQVKEGSNARMGASVLVGGTVTVSNTSVTANTRIFLTCNTPGGTPGFLRVSARTAGTSFTILSSSGSDTSTVGWFLVEPAP